MSKYKWVTIIVVLIVAIVVNGELFTTLLTGTSDGLPVPNAVEIHLSPSTTKKKPETKDECVGAEETTGHTLRVLIKIKTITVYTIQTPLDFIWQKTCTPKAE